MKKQSVSINDAVAKIETGIRELIDVTKVGNENLIKRSKVIFALEALIVNIKGFTQRRLIGSLQPNPEAQVDTFFERFHFLLRGTK